MDREREQGEQDSTRLQREQKETKTDFAATGYVNNRDGSCKLKRIRFNTMPPSKSIFSFPLVLEIIYWIEFEIYE